MHEWVFDFKGCFIKCFRRSALQARKSRQHAAPTEFTERNLVLSDKKTARGKSATPVSKRSIRMVVDSSICQGEV